VRRELIARKLELAPRETLEAPRLHLLELTGERLPRDEQREPWLPIKYGPAGPDDWFGVVPAIARFESSPGRGPESLALVVKVNPSEGLSRTLIPWIIEQKKIALDRPYWEYRCAAETDRTGPREQHVYRLAGTTPALRNVLPRWASALVRGPVSPRLSRAHQRHDRTVARSLRVAPGGPRLSRSAAAANQNFPSVRAT
jgi:hypothetical protein